MEGRDGPQEEIWWNQLWRALQSVQLSEMKGNETINALYIRFLLPRLYFLIPSKYSMSDLSSQNIQQLLSE